MNQTLPASPGVMDAYERFAAAWAAGGEPSIDGFLPTADPDRASALVGLCAIDLEVRLRSGQAISSRDYVERFPSLASDPAALAHLNGIASSLRTDDTRTMDVRASAHDETMTFAGDHRADSTVTYGGHARPAAETVPTFIDPTMTDGSLPELPGLSVRRELGRGGMGIVYEAMQTRINRLVAVKMVLNEHASVSQRLRFHIEAEAVATLKHSNVVALYELGVYRGRPYFVLEHVDGGSLADRLMKGPLPPEEAAKIVAAIADGVAAAHAQGIIHRDLKPANILLTQDGTPKLTDFGLARRGTQNEITASGAIMGTPSYMAPEQARGDGQSIGTHSDVYGLGGLLFACLTGKPPFAGGSMMDVIAKVCDDPAAFPKEAEKLPRDLRVIALKCLEKSPKQRYESAATVALELRRYLAGESISARPPGTVELVVRWVRRKPYQAAFYGTLAAVVIGGSLFGWWWSERQKRLDRIATATSLVDQLVAAKPERIPEFAAKLANTPRESLTALDNRLANAADDRERMQGALTRILLAPQPADALIPYVLIADPAALPGLVEAIGANGLNDHSELWNHAQSNDPKVRIRAITALSRDSTSDSRWNVNFSLLLYDLVKADVALQDAVLQSLDRRVRAELAPMWVQSYVGMIEVMRADNFINHDRQRFTDSIASLVTRSMTGPVAGKTQTLAQFTLHAQPQHIPLVTPLLRESRSDSIAAFQRILADDLEPVRHRAIAIVNALALGDSGSTWPTLRSLRNPDVIDEFIHGCIRYDVNPAVLTSQYIAERDPVIRRAIVLALSEYPIHLIPKDIRPGFEFLLVAGSQTESDSGCQAAIGYLLDKWNLSAKQLPELFHTSNQKNWYRNRTGMTLSIIRGPVSFVSGAPPMEGDFADIQYETPQRRRIPRSFAIGQTEVTVDQMKRMKVHPNPSILDDNGPTGRHPAVGTSWYLAAEFCNALSKTEGLPESEWCYLPNKDGKYASGMTAKPNFLSLGGYRLPTEAEWEFACRAGSDEARFLGNGDEFLTRYANLAVSGGWESRPVGTLKPNPLGLFDIYGNVGEWTHDVVTAVPKSSFSGLVGVAANFTIVINDVPGDLTITDESGQRAIRGAAFESPFKYARSAYRNAFDPSLEKSASTGFRVARTIKP